MIGFGLIDACCRVQLKLFRNAIAITFWFWKVGLGLAYSLPSHSRLAQCFVDFRSFVGNVFRVLQHCLRVFTVDSGCI